MAFTDKQIQNLQPRATPYREWDNGSDPGFGIQVTPKGTKTFFMAYRLENRRRFMKLGRYIDDASLKEARKKAREARSLLEDGIDPQDHRAAELERRKKRLEEAKKAEREEELKGSVKQLFRTYTGHLRSQGKSSHSEVERALTRDALPLIGADTKAKDVRPHHIKLVLHKVIERGALIQANRLRSYLSAAFRYGIEHDNDPRNLKADVLFFIESNPVRDVPKPQKKESPGERDLSPVEIRNMWFGLSDAGISTPTALALKLVLATGGQRLKEVLWAEWLEFDLERKLWEIPSGRTKNGRPHVVPLTDLAISLLRELRPQTGGSKFLFPKQDGQAREPMPLASISRAIARYCENNGIEKWVPRDLRRTCKTRMGEIGISKDIRDRLHNHALDDVSSKHYDRYDYLKEKRRDMHRWGRKLESMLRDNKNDNTVVELRA